MFSAKKAKIITKNSTKTKSLCYNGIMLKKIAKVMIGSIVVLIAMAVFLPSLPFASATNPCTETSTASAAANCEIGTTFQVNVVEVLSVSITTPDTWAEGTPSYSTATKTWSDTGFLRNTVNLSVASNNATGFTATMHAATSASDSTSLVNASKSTVTLPTLTASTKRDEFPDNYWGYSLDTTGDVAGANCTGITIAGHTCMYNGKVYNENTAGNADSYYHALPTSTAPATILTGSGAASGSRDIYFGTKADVSQASGTYTGNVVISVTTGIVNDGYTTPQSDPANPSLPTDDVANDGVATYNSSNNQTVYTTTSSTTTAAGRLTTTTSEITSGDTTKSYADPAGVTEVVSSTKNISNGISLATGLAIGASVAAASGTIFLIAAKRKKSKEDEEEAE